MRLRTAALLAVAVLSTLGCADEATTSAPPQTPMPPQTAPATDPAPLEEDVVTDIEGTLGGDGTLEGGCAWLDVGEGAEAERYEVIWPDGYAVGFDPLELTDADGRVIAGEGDVVRASGRVATDMMSVCQVGTIFEATEVEPA